MYHVINVTVFLVLDFNKCVKIVKTTDVIYLSVLLTGDLQKNRTLYFRFCHFLLQIAVVVG